MKHLYLLLISIVLLSCGNERILQLPEIETAKITEINDVSHAYLFYDETKEDSVELNRKNLIITTNWLVNVDKRLTLGQAIPKIKFLQEKKRNAELHKNEDAKNYFTCNDTSINNLGFVEFTDLVYHFKEKDREQYGPKSESVYDQIKSNIEICELHIKTLNNMTLYINLKTKIGLSIDSVVSFLQNEYESYSCKILLNLDSEITFQDYMTIKSELLKLKAKKIIIETDEFIY